MSRFKPGDIVIHDTDETSRAPGIIVKCKDEKYWIIYWFDIDTTSVHIEHYLRRLKIKDEVVE